MRFCRRMVWSVAVLLPASQACYEYVPIESAAAPIGQLVELRITDPGRVGLAPRFGPGLDRVEGRLVAQRGNDLTLNVLSVRNLDGQHTRWSGESVELDRGFVGSVKGRKLSVVRTSLVATAAAAVVVFTAARSLNGGGKDPIEPGDPIDPPISARVPIGIRIRAIP